jgi:hypothetical protein
VVVVVMEVRSGPDRLRSRVALSLASKCSDHKTTDGQSLDDDRDCFLLRLVAGDGVVEERVGIGGEETSLQAVRVEFRLLLGQCLEWTRGRCAGVIAPANAWCY